MLEPREQQAFNGVVAQLRSEDPQFTRRVDRLRRPPAQWALLGVLLWSLAPFCLVYGGWTGALEAALAIGYGSHLMRKRRRWANASGHR